MMRRLTVPLAALVLALPLAHAVPLAQTYSEDFEDGAPEWFVDGGEVVCDAVPGTGCMLRLRETLAIAYPMEPALGVTIAGPVSVASFDVRFGVGARGVGMGLGQVTLGGTHCTLHADVDSVWVSSGSGTGGLGTGAATLVPHTWYHVELQQLAHQLSCSVFDAQGALVGSAATVVTAEWTPVRFLTLGAANGGGDVWVDDVAIEMAV